MREKLSPPFFFRNPLKTLIEPLSALGIGVDIPKSKNP